MVIVVLSTPCSWQDGERSYNMPRAERVDTPWTITTRSINALIDGRSYNRCIELKDVDVEWGCTDCPLECFEDMVGKAVEIWRKVLRERGIDGLLEVYGIRVWE